jgi:hypothetical protein
MYMYHSVKLMCLSCICRYHYFSRPVRGKGRVEHCLGEFVYALGREHGLNVSWGKHYMSVFFINTPIPGKDVPSQHSFYIIKHRTTI